MIILESYLKDLNEGKDWIVGAVKNKGALHKALNISQDKKIPVKKLAIKPGDSDKLKKRKILAKTLIKIGKKRKLGESLTENEQKTVKLIKEVVTKRKTINIKNKQLKENVIKIANKKKNGESLNEIENKIVSVIREDIITTGVSLLIGTVAYQLIRERYDKCYKKASEYGLLTEKGKIFYLTCKRNFIKDQLINLEKAKIRCKTQPNPTMCTKKINFYINSRKIQLERIIRKLEKKGIINKIK